MAPPVVPGGSMDPPNQLKAYEAYVKLLADPNAKDESKLQACQELSENFEVCIWRKFCRFFGETLHFIGWVCYKFLGINTP